jgi:molybdopterin/thiamine biosynthesis adenylyltransferase/rhodanese-related sulfurtransferase
MATTTAAKEIAPSEALELIRRGATLVDVREPAELATGVAAGAIAIAPCDVERLLPEVARRDAPVLVICASGVRSCAAASRIAALGFEDVRSVSGGFARWRREGLPVRVDAPADGLDRERYARQLMLPEVGEAGQRRLLASRVMIVGAGGLGSPAALYLAAAGVGRITLVDDDAVERSNLQRQVLHTDARTGQPKVDSARATLAALNPDVEVIPLRTRLDERNVLDGLAGHDVVVDGSDNFATRYLLSDACVRLRIPDVHGSVFRYEGQVTVFGGDPPGPCYRCLYPAPPPPELAPSCVEAGVLGVLPGTIGMLQATETLKLLLGLGEPLSGRLLHFDALRGRFSEFEVLRDPACPVCSGRVAGRQPRASSSR